MRIGLNFDNMPARYHWSTDTQKKAADIARLLPESEEDFNGWVNWPIDGISEVLPDLESEAARIRSLCDTLVVIGIGGSYLGTAAILDALGGNKAGCPEILFAGNNLSGNYHSRLLKQLEGKDICICVVSKSGTTMEPCIAFSLIKAILKEKYGDKASERIIAITDPVRGVLREEAVREGYRIFEIPQNIGGRYSAFTPAILFPLAVAGIDLASMVQGAKTCAESKWIREDGLDYALYRYVLMEAGKSVEVFGYYDPCFEEIGEWIKQLFAESEGKEGKGLLPVSVTLSTDLHSIGQFLQEGNQIFFETLLNVKDWGDDVSVPECAGNAYAGKSLNKINALALEGVKAAHSKAGIPIIQIDIERNDEYCLGQLMYFMMMTTAVTGKLMGVDPFTQPGVEAYKTEIRTLLN